MRKPFIELPGPGPLIFGKRLRRLRRFLVNLLLDGATFVAGSKGELCYEPDRPDDVVERADWLRSWGVARP